MEGVAVLAPQVGVKAACEAMMVARATYYRRQRQLPSEAPKAPRKASIYSSPRALSDAERSMALEVLRSERFLDKAPRQVHAELLDEGTYICSPRTFYRVLEGEHEVRDRRNQRRHPAYTKPELMATAPNSLWSWDITKLRGPKGTWYQLYVLLDVFSRYVVGWLLAHREDGQLAERLIREAWRKQGILAGQLTIHADRGPAMTSKTGAELMGDLTIKKSHSRPQVSNDNPYSEAQFKTLKYHPDFPDRFGSIEDARAFCGHFFGWYNNDHRHSGIAQLTPSTVHYGRADQVLLRRQQTLDEAYMKAPQRFNNRPPQVKRPPTEAWINPPAAGNVAETPRAQPTADHKS
jgi:putative transposase